MAIAWWTPLPPQRSGIADSSYALLGGLSAAIDVVAVVDDSVKDRVAAPPGVDVVGAREAASTRFTLDAYQLGNNWDFHGFMLRAALSRPGLLVLYDPSLYDFFVTLTGGTTSPILAEEVAYDSKGRFSAVTPPTIDVGKGRTDVDRLRLPMCRRLVESSRLVLVQSTAIRDVVRGALRDQTSLRRARQDGDGGASSTGGRRSPG